MNAITKEKPTLFHRCKRGHFVSEIDAIYGRCFACTRRYGDPFIYYASVPEHVVFPNDHPTVDYEEWGEDL